MLQTSLWLSHWSSDVRETQQMATEEPSWLWEKLYHLLAGKWKDGKRWIWYNWKTEDPPRSIMRNDCPAIHTMGMSEASQKHVITLINVHRSLDYSQYFLKGLLKNQKESEVSSWKTHLSLRNWLVSATLYSSWRGVLGIQSYCTSGIPDENLCLRLQRKIWRCMTAKIWTVFQAPDTFHQPYTL